MEAKEIMGIIVSILAAVGLFTCFVAAAYCLYSMLVVDREINRYLKRVDDELAKLEKEE